MIEKWKLEEEIKSLQKENEKLKSKLKRARKTLDLRSK